MVLDKFIQIPSNLYLWPKISYVKHLFQAPRAIGKNLNHKQWNIASKMVKINIENDIGAVLNLLGIYRKCIESKNCCIDTALHPMQTTHFSYGQGWKKHVFFVLESGIILQFPYIKVYEFKLK